MKSKTTPVAPVAIAESTAPTTKLGELIPGSVPGALIVEHGDSGPLRARATIALDEAGIARAIAARQPVLLLFEDGDPRRPIVVGLVQPGPGAALLGALLASPVSQSPAGENIETPPEPLTEARLDGTRVVLEGKDEVTLKCGDASITLRRDGKLILRGAYIETTAKGVNRIRGGSVKIN